MAQKFTYRYSIKLNEAEDKSFNAFFESRADTLSVSDGTGKKGAKHQPKWRKADALRELIEVGLKHSGHQVEIGRARTVNVDALLMSDIREEIRKIGNNINQLAKVMNSIARKGEQVSESTERKMSKSLQMCVEHMSDILRRLLNDTSVMDNNVNTVNTGNSGSTK